MAQEFDFSYPIDPAFRRSLSSAQQATLEKIERLSELDPELTRRLARTLDRLQKSQPYQPISRPVSASASADSAQAEVLLPQASLSPEEMARREDFLNQELSALLAVAGQLNAQFEAERRRATPDRHFRDALRSQFK